MEYKSASIQLETRGWDMGKIKGLYGKNRHPSAALSPFPPSPADIPCFCGFGKSKKKYPHPFINCQMLYQQTITAWPGKTKIPVQNQHRTAVMLQNLSFFSAKGTQSFMMAVGKLWAFWELDFSPTENWVISKSPGFQSKSIGNYTVFNKTVERARYVLIY